MTHLAQCCLTLSEEPNTSGPDIQISTINVAHSLKLYNDVICHSLSYKWYLLRVHCMSTFVSVVRNCASVSWLFATVVLIQAKEKRDFFYHFQSGLKTDLCNKAAWKVKCQLQGNFVILSHSRIHILLEFWSRNLLLKIGVYIR